MRYIKYINPLLYIRVLVRFIKKRSFKKYGKNFIFDPFSQIVTPSMICVGDDVFIGYNAYISAEVDLDDYVMIGPNVTIIGGDHSFGEQGKRTRFLSAKDNYSNKISIKKDVWIGANVTILKGITIGEGTIVGAGSVVVKSLPPYSICVGNPCTPRKKIFSGKELIGHLEAFDMSRKEIENILLERGSFFG